MWIGWRGPLMSHAIGAPKPWEPGLLARALGGRVPTRATPTGSPTPPRRSPSSRRARSRARVELRRARGLARAAGRL